jgi:integrase
MQRVRGIFKFAFDEELILAPVRYGQGFDKPKLDAVRRAREAHRSEHGDRMFEAHELRLILEALSGKNAALKAMTLLGLNCGFGQSDVSNLPTRNVNLETGWVDFARVKTAVPRRIPLWPETAEAIREWLPLRPKAKDSSNSKLLFLTIRGARWVTVSAKTGAPKDAVAQEFVKLLRKLGMKRPGVSFYALRHTFEMIAGESRDQVAVNAVMGHVDNSMAGAYRERISDERLKVVVETVRQWLLADTATDPTATKPEEVDLIELPVKPSDDDLAPKLRLFVG